MRLSVTAKVKGTDGGARRKGRRTREKYVGLTEERGRGGQGSSLPEAKWRTERRVPSAPCSADPINIIPILEIC